MYLITINPPELYKIVQQHSEFEVSNNFVIDLIYLASFWKLIDDLSKYNNDINLVQYKLETLNFIEDTINVLAQIYDTSLYNSYELVMSMFPWINIENDYYQSEMALEHFDVNTRNVQYARDIIEGTLESIDPNAYVYHDFVDKETMIRTIEKLILINKEIVFST